MKSLKINEEIPQRELFLIDENGRQVGVISRDQALSLAYEKGLDVALVGENANPPVAKLLDYGKYLYNQQKQASKQKSKSGGSELKEIRFGIKIEQHDLEVKTAKAKQFLLKGDKVKVTVILRGREMIFKDRVGDLIDKIVQSIGAQVEKPLEKAGNRFSVILVKAKESNNEIKNS